MAQRSLLDFVVSKTRKLSESENDEALQQPVKKVAIESKIRTFQSVWLNQFSWLEYNADTRKMFCKICRASNKQNSFTMDGAGNLQRSTVVKHNDSKEHRQAEDADQLRRQIFNVEKSPTEARNVVVSESEMHLFRTVYFVAKEQLPNSFVNMQLKFLALSGIDPKMQDLHSDTIHDVQRSLTWVISKKLKSDLQKAGFYGVLCDESTDLSVHKKLIMYIRYVSPYTQDVETRFIGNLRIPDGTAATITEMLHKELNSLGLDLSKLVGLGSDGASVMVGNRAGVGQLLRKDSPQLTHIHCVAHRLSLACSDAAKDIPYLRTYKDTLRNLYIHVSGSGVRTYKLEALQKIMNEPTLKLKDPINIRWLSMENAVKVIHQCYGSIVAYLESNEGKNTVGDAIADGLLKDVLHYKFPVFTAFLVDILSVVGLLCRQLQSEALDISQLDGLCDSTIGRLKALKTMCGPHTKELEDGLSHTANKIFYKGIQLTHANEKSSIDKMKTTYIEKVADSITSRMRNDTTPILKAFEVFVPASQDLMRDADIKKSSEDLSHLYGVPVDELKLELCGLKPLLEGTYRSLTLSGIAKVLLRRHREDFPHSVRLTTIAMCIPVSSVACERGFSLQNRIKTKARTSLTPENLDVLMQLSGGPEVDVYPYEEAISHWKREKKRRLARLYQPSKSRTQLEKCD